MGQKRRPLHGPLALEQANTARRWLIDQLRNNFPATAAVADIEEVGKEGDHSSRDLAL